MEGPGLNGMNGRDSLVSTLSIDRTSQEPTGERAMAQCEAHPQRLGRHHRGGVPLGFILAFRSRFDRLEELRVPDTRDRVERLAFNLPRRCGTKPGGGHGELRHRTAKEPDRSAVAQGDWALNAWKRDEAESGSENPGTSAKVADPRRPEGALHCGTGNLFGDIEPQLVTHARNPPKSAVRADRHVLGWKAAFASAIRKIRADTEIRGPTLLSRPWTLLGSPRFVGRIHSRRSSRIVAFHSAWTDSLQGQVVRRHRIPKAMFPHAGLQRDSLRKKWACRTDLDGVAANRRFTAESAMDCCLGSAVPRVVPPPVPVPGTRERLRASTGAADLSKLILQAGRITRCKGLETVIRSLFSLRLRTIWECRIAGASASIDVDTAFGLSLVKGMLAGLPVVGPARGGLVETLQPAGVEMVIPVEHRGLGSRPHWQLTNADQRIASAIRVREVDTAGHEPVSRTGQNRDWRRLVSETGTIRPMAWNS